MKKAWLVGLMICCLAGMGFAVNITVYDTRSPGIGVGLEDEETDSSASGQEWDLEAFFWDGSVLTLVGGFDFVNGVRVGNHTYKAGDIFLDDTGDGAIPGYKVTTDPVTGLPVDAAGITYELFGWDYALDIDWANGIFDIVQLTFTGGADGSRVQTVKFGSHQVSNPYVYVDQGVVLFDDVSFTWGWVATWPGLSDGGSGIGHYWASFDLSNAGITLRRVHSTLECGNDDIYGQVPDGGATVALLGIAILGVAALARKLG